MKPATEKQKKYLRDFAKKKELSSILKGKDFDELNSPQLSIILFHRLIFGLISMFLFSTLTYVVNETH